MLSFRNPVETCLSVAAVVQGSRFEAKTHVKGPSLPLQSVDDVQRGNGLPLGVLSVGDSITDGSLEESLQYSTSLCLVARSAMVSHLGMRSESKRTPDTNPRR